MTLCNAFIVSFRDVLSDDLTYQATCAPCGWEGTPTASDTVARAQMHQHKEQQEGNE